MGLMEADVRAGGVIDGVGRRGFDVALSVLLLLVTAPLLLLAVAFVLVADGRPVFFGHRRVGRGGRIFRCWKLRTMAVDAEERLAREAALRERHRENGYKLPTGQDPRVPRWGRILRRTYVDELPQLYNVLAGCMSLVGPRPIVPEEVELFGPDAGVLLRVKPGIFGAWNSRGRARPPYPERAAVEVAYVRRRTWWGDIAILARSVIAVLQGQGDE